MDFSTLHYTALSIETVFSNVHLIVVDCRRPQCLKDRGTQDVMQVWVYYADLAQLWVLDGAGG